MEDTPQQSVCAQIMIDRFYNFEHLATTTQNEMMRLCRIVEATVRNGDLDTEKAERHYLRRVRSVNKQVYKFVNLSRQLRNEYKWYGGESLEHTRTKNLFKMFHMLSERIFRVMRLIRVNVADVA